MENVASWLFVRGEREKKDLDIVGAEWSSSSSLYHCLIQSGRRLPYECELITSVYVAFQIHAEERSRQPDCKLKVRSEEEIYRRVDVCVLDSVLAIKTPRRSRVRRRLVVMRLTPVYACEVKAPSDIFITLWRLRAIEVFRHLNGKNAQVADRSQKFVGLCRYGGNPVCLIVCFVDFVPGLAVISDYQRRGDVCLKVKQPNVEAQRLF